MGLQRDHSNIGVAINPHFFPQTVCYEEAEFKKRKNKTNPIKILDQRWSDLASEN